MSSKLLILTALLIAPFIAHADPLGDLGPGPEVELRGDMMKMNQLCPSETNCREFQKRLDAHMKESTPQFHQSFLREIEIAVLTAAKRKGQSVPSDQKKFFEFVKSYSVAPDDAQEVTDLHFGRSTSKKQTLQAPVINPESEFYMKERARRLRIYAKSNLEGVTEMQRHHMLQEADRIERSLSDTGAVGANATATKALK